jgi:hypothetical protein
MKLERGDVLVDALGEIYVVFGFPCITQEFITLQNGRYYYCDFIVRETAYVEESFKKIGSL